MPPQTATEPATSDRVTLYFREGSSDKVYQAAIEPSGPGFVVNFAFGRRGATLQTGSKTAGPVDYTAAKKIYDKLVREKTAKGYTPGEDGTPYAHTDREQRVGAPRPQLLNPISEEELDRYLADDRWWMQEKFDGKRMLIQKSGGDTFACNRQGLSTSLPQSIIRAVQKLDTDRCVLDGEAVGEVFHSFDLLLKGATDYQKESYAARYEALVDLIDTVSANQLRYAPTAHDAQEKKFMLQNMRALRKEGVVFKDRTAKYTPGRPASGGTQLKCKFYATCSCIVAGLTAGRRSVGLELLEGKKRISVGNVTIPPNHDVPGLGHIVEVRYLYAYPGGSLYQPVYLGPRDDIRAAACVVGQLKYRADSEDER